jgi:hypothetical protein
MYEVKCLEFSFLCLFMVTIIQASNHHQTAVFEDLGDKPPSKWCFIIVHVLLG